MPTRNISLTPEQDAFVDSVVEAGEIIPGDGDVVEGSDGRRRHGLPVGVERR